MYVLGEQNNYHVLFTDIIDDIFLKFSCSLMDPRPRCPMAIDGNVPSMYIFNLALSLLRHEIDHNICEALRDDISYYVLNKLIFCITITACSYEMQFKGTLPLPPPDIHSLTW